MLAKTSKELEIAFFSESDIFLVGLVVDAVGNSFSREPSLLGDREDEEEDDERVRWFLVSDVEGDGKDRLFGLSGVLLSISFFLDSGFDKLAGSLVAEGDSYKFDLLPMGDSENFLSTRGLVVCFVGEEGEVAAAAAAEETDDEDFG